MNIKLAYCLHGCGVIYHGRYRDTPGRQGVEPDYDPADDPVTWRHMNGYAGCAATRFAVPRPRIVTLCGSTRFRDEFLAEQKRLTFENVIVISVGTFGHLEADVNIGTNTDPSALKIDLDELHKRKIDVADAIHVINVGGYIGTSTRSEIEYAHVHGKNITYMEPVT